MVRRRKTVTRESATGRNIKFRDNKTDRDMTRSEFVKKIESGKYQGYHVRKIHGVKTLVSNPGGKESNNLD